MRAAPRPIPPDTYPTGRKDRWGIHPVALARRRAHHLRSRQFSWCQPRHQGARRRHPERRLHVLLSGAQAMAIVTIERRGRIAVVRFDRGDTANAMSHQVMRELLAAARSFEDDTETSAIVVTGGTSVF